ncbi:MAG: MATE family efflux transporter [Clostridiaceae bacterium]|nr:MATE family efflux transporter [Clostridiaceae bacterium]
MDNKQFYKRMFALAFPIAMQNLLSSCGYLIDTAMVVGLGNVATSAIGIATRWSFIMNVLIFGVCSGSAALIAQYWGAGDERNIRRSVGIALVVGTGISIIYVLAAAFFPMQMMMIFTDEAAVMKAGAGYIRTVCLAMLFNSATFVVSTAVRSTEDVKTPFIASACGVVVNIVLNYTFIYGHFGMPKMGLNGAALGTVIAMAAQAVVIIVIAYKKKSVFLRSIRQLFEWDKAFVKKYFAVSTPVLFNEIFWSVGTSIYSVILARQGSENYSAYTIFNSVHEVFFVFFVGLCNACAIMVGKTIGEDRLDEAYHMAKKYLIAFPLVSVVLGGLQILLRNPVLSIMSIETEGARLTASHLLVLHGLLMPFINIPYVAVVGIFRAGGDTRFGFFVDAGSVYLIGIPVLWYLAYMTEVSFVALVAGMYIGEYALKTFLCIWRFKSGKWIRRLT